MSQSYFFALLPRCLSIEHSFEKNISTQTKYRLALYKGTQLCDQTTLINAKIINGKINLPTQSLSFNVTFYTPLKNIQFTLKLKEKFSNQQEIEIASYLIPSSDYIKLFKTQKQSHFSISGMLLTDLTIEFQLFLQKSQQSVKCLTEKYLDFINSKVGVNKEDQMQSQRSSVSRQFVRNSNGFIAPQRSMDRNRSPQAKSNSRAKSKSIEKTSLISPPKTEPNQIKLSAQKQKQQEESKKSITPYQQKSTNRLIKINPLKESSLSPDSAFTDIIMENTNKSPSLQIQQQYSSKTTTIKTLQSQGVNIAKREKWVKNERRIKTTGQGMKNTNSMKADKLFQHWKSRLLYGIFLLISVFLIYIAMTPRRRV